MARDSWRDKVGSRYSQGRRLGVQAPRSLAAVKLGKKKFCENLERNGGAGVYGDKDDW